MRKSLTMLLACVGCCLVTVQCPQRVDAGSVNPPTTVLTVTMGPPANGTNSVQKLTFGAGTTGGTYRLKYGSETGGPISWSATNATLTANLQTALRAVPAIGVNGVTVTNGVGLTAGIGEVVITFAGPKTARLAVPEITVASNSLTGTTHTLVAAVVTPGVTADGRLYKKGTLDLDCTVPQLWVNMADGPNVDWQEYPSASAGRQALYVVAEDSTTDVTGVFTEGDMVVVDNETGDATTVTIEGSNMGLKVNNTSSCFVKLDTGDWTPVGPPLEL